MEKLPDAIEEFLKCRINACDESWIDFQSSNKIQYVKEIIRNTLLDEIIPYYKRHGYHTDDELYNLLLEPIKNANFHRDSKLQQDIRFSLILSPRALVAGYFDGDSYFKQEDLKKRLEERILPKRKHKLPHIFDVSNLIYVDTNFGKLYIGVSVMNPKFFSEMK